MNVIGLTFICGGICMIVMVTVSLEIGIIGLGISAIAYGIMRLRQREVR